ncbi:MAG: ABC transporter permease [Verrucomicrobia bacterium]|jgi:ABC-2 type transport system permease protein|nr:ABC transporter permease [Verrucomicrobiota bacterium]
MNLFLRQLGNELWKLFGKKRTYIGFGTFLVAQNAMLLAFHFSDWQQGTARLLEGNGYLAEEFISALTVAVLMLIPQIILLMPLYACLVGGDMVAKESEEGTLRMILCRPISRVRLLTLKWLAGMVFCVVLVASLGVMAVLFARLWFPWGGLFVFAPGPVRVFGIFTGWEGLAYYGASHLILAINACTMFGLAFLFSSFNMKPAAATILALSFLLLNLVMEAMPFFEEYKELCLTHHFRGWLLVFQTPVDWLRLGQSLGILLGVNLTAFLVGLAGFHCRDIKS